MLLEPALVEPFLMEGAECRRQATQRPDQTKLRSDDFDHQSKASFASKVEPLLGLLLHLHQRISNCEQIRVQVVAAICRKGQVADFGGNVEGATHQIPATSD